MPGPGLGVGCCCCCFHPRSPPRLDGWHGPQAGDPQWGFHPADEAPRGWERRSVAVAPQPTRVVASWETGSWRALPQSGLCLALNNGPSSREARAPPVAKCSAGGMQGGEKTLPSWPTCVACREHPVSAPPPPMKQDQYGLPSAFHRASSWTSPRPATKHVERDWTRLHYKKGETRVSPISCSTPLILLRLIGLKLPFLACLSSCVG